MRALDRLVRALDRLVHALGRLALAPALDQSDGGADGIAPQPPA